MPRESKKTVAAKKGAVADRSKELGDEEEKESEESKQPKEA